MGRARVRAALVALPLLGALVGPGALGCLGEAERSYYDDLAGDSSMSVPLSDGSTPTKVRPDGAVHAEASTQSNGDAMDEEDAPSLFVSGPDVDVPDVVDSSLVDATDDVRVTDAVADAPVVVDAAPEAGPMPVACGGMVCDTTHSSSPACSGAKCTYGACSPGFGDCDIGTNTTNANGCETALNSQTNCSACGVACDTTHSIVSGCTGTTCTYSSCAPGWTMCSIAPPNAGGCTCHTPGCCNDKCQTTHSNGLGNSFYDCNPLGTLTDNSALAACAAFTGNLENCTDGYTCTVRSGQPKVGPYVCDSSITRCWSYGGSDIGTVSNSSCPGDPTFVSYGKFN